MNQSKNESKVRSILRKNSINYKTVHALIENGPLTTQEVMRITEYYNSRMSNTICKSPEIYFMGDTHRGVWYLEYQNQDAREKYYNICKEAEKRIEIKRKNQLIVLPVNFEMPSILCVFQGKGDEHTAEDVWRNAGGNFIVIKSHLHSLAKARVLLVRGKKPKVYRINPEHESICGDEARKIFGGYLTSGRQS
jgi:hypothetical protein